MPSKVEGRKDNVDVDAKIRAAVVAAHEILDQVIEGVLAKLDLIQLEEGDTLYDADAEHKMKTSTHQLRASLDATLAEIVNIAQAASQLGFTVPADVRNRP